MMFPLFTSRGILGLNARNLLYIKPFNLKKAIAFADDKLKTKAYLAARGIPTARMYGRIATRDQLRAFDFSALPDECVLKPNYGFGGEGIIVLRGRNKQGEFLRQDKSAMPIRELTEHIEDILDGKFSVNGRRDSAFFEHILTSDACFARFRPAGLPDIRIIVFNLVPVMAMLRIPTPQSGGVANVHRGGIGIGIDIAKGVTTFAAQYHRMISVLPHGEKVAGHAIPRWNEILLIASRIQQITNLGYLAADITIDAQMGPVLLEVNARAGLMVQVANLAPLRARLERVKGIRVSNPEKGVRIGQDLFGERAGASRRAEEKREEKPLLGTKESIEIACEGATIEVPALISADTERTVFSPDLIADLLDRKGADVADEEERTYRVKFTLQGKKLQTLVQTGAVPAPERAVIGRRDLAGFLIDPTRRATAAVKRSAVKANPQAVDSLLAQIDRDLSLLKSLKPVNLAEERALLERDRRHNPIFVYQELPADLAETRKRLATPVRDSTPIGLLLGKKRRELIARLDLLERRGSAQEFTQCSRALFGTPDPALIVAAHGALRGRVACDLPPPASLLLNAQKTREKLLEALEKYGLHEWEVAVRERIVADCTVGGGKIFVREGALFSPIRVEALIAHEIETHVLTSENGAHQPFELFRHGTGNYLETQEGLAIHNQNRVLTPYHEKKFGPARSVLAVAYALDHSFADTRAYLEEELGYTPARALTKTIDVKRGIGRTSEPGGFTKGIIYFRGLQAIEHFLTDGGDLRRLYIGKISLEDLELIESVEGLEKPLLLPEWLRS